MPPKQLVDEDRLSVRSDGRHYKKVRGRVYYFGRDPEAAMAEWKRVKDYLLAGEVPPEASNQVTVKAVCNHFLVQRKSEVLAGRLKGRTWQDYYLAAALLCKSVGGNRAVEHLGPRDFARVLESMSNKARSTQKRMAICIRTILRAAEDDCLIERAPKFGEAFRRHKRSVASGVSVTQRPSKLIDRDKIVSALLKASPFTRAMILLGINCGFGPTDCAELPLSALLLDEGLIDFGRSKNANPRLCPLWPITVDALRVAVRRRPKPKDPAHNGLVFITKYGRPWVRVSTPGAKISNTNAVSRMASRLGLKFYSLRHTFNTIGSFVPDKEARYIIMGHSFSGMQRFYLHMDDPTIRREAAARLRVVTDHVYEWLFTRTLPPADESGGSAGGARA